MPDITLSEFLGVQGIWGRILALSPFPFIAQFTPEFMDKHLILNHGDKIVFHKIPSLGLDYVAQDAVHNFTQKWTDLISIESLQLNIGADNTRKVSETLTHAETRINTQENLNKVSAFNTDELITNDGSNSSHSDDIDFNKTRVLTDEDLSLEQAYLNLSLKQKNIIISTVNSDLASLFTLDIY